MPGIFAGKFGFRSTNSSGAAVYLTALAGQDAVLPTMSAAQLTEDEHVLLYATPSGDLLVGLPLRQAPSGPTRIVWCAGDDDLGIVTAALDEAGAQEIQIAGLGGPTSSWSILDHATQTLTPLVYVLGARPPCLVYGGDSVPGSLGTIAPVPITPGYAAIVVAGRAPPSSDFRYASLAGLDFTGIDLTGADFGGATLTGTVFRRATLTRATFTGAALAGADLGGATLTGATFSDTDLTGVIWGDTGVLAAGATFDGAIMTGCVLGNDTTQGKLASASFAGADLSHADLTNVDLTSATLQGANFTGATLSSSILTSARLGASDGGQPAILSFAIMQNVTLDKADLFAVDCSAATMNGAKTTVDNPATLQQANFANAYLEGITLRKANLQGAILDGACLVNVDLTGANLGAPAQGGMAASLVGTCLHGAIFTNAVLHGTNLANAAVSVARGSLPVRRCTEDGPMPPPPAVQQLNYVPTTGLDATTLAPTTICPNGASFASNQARGTSLAAALKAPAGPSSWLAPSCLVPGASAAG